jgi:hypothetical protein
MMTLDELIHGIHDLENYLNKFEEKYRLRSEDFYRLATAGRLEQSNDFIEWLGVYEIKLKREQKYQQRLAEMLEQQRDKLNLPLSEPAMA